MAIKIKRSSGNLAPAELAAGQLAYSEGSSNGGTLYYGEIGGTVREIAGKKFVDKLNGIEAGAEVNTVDSVNGLTGTVVLDTGDLADFNSAVDARITSSKLTTELGYTPENAANKGQANGYASLDSSGLVPSSQLPSYVDDVLEYANSTSFPSTGQSTGKIYVAIDTGKTWRWSGSAYVEISASPGSTDSVTEGSTNLYFTNARARSAISASQNLSYNESTGALQGPDLSTYATGSQLSTLASSLATVATTGSYNDLTNKPTLFSGSYTDLTSKPTLFSGSFADLTSKPTTLSGYGITDSFSGSYTDLSNKPTLFTDVVQDTTPQLGGSLDVNGNSIVSVSDGDITLAPNGTGDVQLQADVFVGRTNSDVQISSNGTADLIFTTNNNTNGGTIRLYDGANGNIAIAPNGTGSIVLDGLNWPQADGTNNQVLVTNGSGQLSWATQSGGLANIVEDTTPQLGGDLDVQTSKITTSTTNGDVKLQVGGSGDIVLYHVASSGGFVRVGDGTNPGVIVANGAEDLLLMADPDNESGQAAINLEATSGNVTLSPTSAGVVASNTSTTRVGTGSAAPFITSNGAYALTLTANGQVTTGAPSAPQCAASSFIQITNGTAGNLLMSGGATGGAVVQTAFGANNINQRFDAASSAGPVLLVRRNRTDVLLSAMNGVQANTTYAVRDSTLTNASYARKLATYSTTGGHSFQFEISSDNFTTATRSLAIENLTLALGPTSGTQSQTVTTNHAGDLILSTNRGTNSGTIQIFAGVDGSISITPNGSGSVILDGLTYPQADGTAGQLLKTNGSGVLSFTSDIDDGTF